MARTLTTVAIGTGGSMAAVATTGLCLSVAAGNPPEPALIGLLVAAVVVLVAGFVSIFEHRSRLWASEMEAQLQARRHALEMPRAALASSPQLHTSRS